MTFLEAFDTLDWEGFARCWSAQPTVFFPFEDTPQRVDGRDAVEARFRRFFEETRARGSGPRYLGLEPLALRVEEHGDAGIVTFLLAPRSLPGGGTRPAGRRTLVFLRDGEDWKLVHLHASQAASERKEG